MSVGATATLPLQRGDGIAEIGLVAGPGGARVRHLHQRSPLRVLFPTPETGDIATAVLITTSGGLAGGDRLAVRAALGQGARAVIASQAAEKVYRSDGSDARFDVSLGLEPGTWLEWLPQETILFDGARLRRRFDAALAGDARLLACDCLVLGRRARGETFTHGLVQDRWEIRRDGELIWADAFRLDDPGVIANPAGLDGAAAIGTVVFVGSDCGRALELTRALLDAHPRAGASIVGGVMIARILDKNPARAKAALGRIVATLRAEIADLPREVPKLWQC